MRLEKQLEQGNRKGVLVARAVFCFSAGVGIAVAVVTVIIVSRGNGVDVRSVLLGVLLGVSFGFVGFFGCLAVLRRVVEKYDEGKYN